jgi:hypothetical protein
MTYRLLVPKMCKMQFHLSRLDLGMEEEGGRGRESEGESGRGIGRGREWEEEEKEEEEGEKIMRGQKEKINKTSSVWVLILVT